MSQICFLLPQIGVRGYILVKLNIYLTREEAYSSSCWWFKYTRNTKEKDVIYGWPLVYHVPIIGYGVLTFLAEILRVFCTCFIFGSTRLVGSHFEYFLFLINSPGVSAHRSGKKMFEKVRLVNMWWR